MAYINKPSNKNKKLKEGEQGSTIIPSVGETPTQPSQNSSASTGTFTNYNRYLNANKGQGKELGQKIENKFNKQISDTGLDTIKDNAAKDIVKNKVDYSNMQKDLEKGQYNKINKDQFNSAKGNYYKGPNTHRDVSGLDNATNVGSQLKQDAKNTETFSGQKQLIKDQFDRSNYSRGQSNFDTFLLNRQGKGNLNNINKNVDKFNNDINTVKTGIDRQAFDTKADLESQIAALNEAAQSAYSKELSGLTNETETNRQKYNSDRDNLLAGRYQNVRGADPSGLSYLKNAGYDLNKVLEGSDDSHFYSEDQVNKLNAISELLGKTNPFQSKGVKNEFMNENIMNQGKQANDLTQLLNQHGSRVNQNRRGQLDRQKSGQFVLGESDISSDILTDANLRFLNKHQGGTRGDLFNIGDHLNYGGDIVGFNTQGYSEAGKQLDQLNAIRNSLGLSQFGAANNNIDAITYDKDKINKIVHELLLKHDPIDPLITT